ELRRRFCKVITNFFPSLGRGLALVSGWLPRTGDEEKTSREETGNQIFVQHGNIISETFPCRTHDPAFFQHFSAIIHTCKENDRGSRSAHFTPLHIRSIFS
ncbi:MAG: hypothetical protein ACKOPT_05845, partial [Cyanobium sp.]